MSKNTLKEKFKIFELNDENVTQNLQNAAKPVFGEILQPKCLHWERKKRLKINMPPSILKCQKREHKNEFKIEMNIKTS